MLSTIRNVAISSARQSSSITMRSARFAPLALKRCYATEKNDGKDNEKDEQKEQTEQQAATEESQQQAPTETETKVDPSKVLAEKDKKIAELQDAYIRCLADQENLRERTRKEIATAQEYAIQKFAKDLLDTVDILGMALAAVPAELRTKEAASKSELAKDADKLVDQISNLYTGVSMTEAELVKTLKRHGVEQHNPEGEVFDPNKHQALFQTPVPDKQAGTVFVVQKLGYTLKGRVLRPAQVGVVAEPPSESS